MRNVILLRSITPNLCGVLWIPGRRMRSGAWGSDWSEIITSINWTLGIGLSLKSLNDKSPLSLSPPCVSSGPYPRFFAQSPRATSLAERLKPCLWPSSPEIILGFLPCLDVWARMWADTVPLHSSVLGYMMKSWVLKCRNLPFWVHFRTLIVEWTLRTLLCRKCRLTRF